MTAELRAGREPTIDAAFVAAYSRALEDDSLGPRLVADLLTLPDEKTLGQVYDEVPIDALHHARSELMRAIGRHNRERLIERHARLDRDDPEDSSATAVGERRLKALCLDFLVALGEPDLEALAVHQVEHSRNVSNQSHALMSLVRSGAVRRDEALDIFRSRWRNEQLVYDKWFLAQASAPLPDTAARLARVVASADFPLQMLSRVFSTCEAFFCLNRAGFNERSGSGYRLL
jgi:aminopeptidase N